MPTPSAELIDKAEKLHCHWHVDRLQPGKAGAPDSFLFTRNGGGTTFLVPIDLAVPEVLEWQVREDDAKQLRACTPQLSALPNHARAPHLTIFRHAHD